MEIQQYLTSLFDDKIEENVLSPELYKFSSFYPSPIGDMIREELINNGVEISKETLKERCRCRVYKDGKQEWVLDGDKVLVRMEPEPVIVEGETVPGWVAPKFTRPYSESKKK